MGSEVVRRFIWIVLIMSAIAYGAYILFGNIAQAQAESPQVVEVYDLIDARAKTHRLSGIIMVPTACHTISVKAKQLETGEYHVYFSTSGDSHGCVREPHALSFRVVVAAPLVGTHFSASLDWQPLDFHIVSQARSTES